MMGMMVPETCWASNKICNKNLCCIQLAFYSHILTMMHGQNHITYLKLSATIYYTHFSLFSSLQSLQKQWTEVKQYIKSCMNCNTNFIQGKFTQIFFINVHYFNSSVTTVSGIQAGWPAINVGFPKKQILIFFCTDHGAHWASSPFCNEG